MDSALLQMQPRMWAEIPLQPLLHKKKAERVFRTGHIRSSSVRPMLRKGDNNQQQSVELHPLALRSVHVSITRDRKTTCMVTRRQTYYLKEKSSIKIKLTNTRFVLTRADSARLG